MLDPLKMGDISAEVISFRSALDGTNQQAGLCGPASDSLGSQPLPLLVELQPGSILNLEAALAEGRRHLGLIGEPAVWLRPGGRGPGTVFQGHGEVDVFEAIDAAASRYPVDPSRISLYGFSMGGAGAWYLASHFPDRFAAIAPFSGYNDYRLWFRPGGMTFPLLPWEVPSWRARSAVFLLENLRHVGVWMIHGAWDRGVNGGVDVAHAREAAKRFQALGIAHRYTELPATGHDAAFMQGPLLGEVLRWLVTHRRPADPSRVSFSTYELRHNRAYWVEINQLARYGGIRARVVAEAVRGAVILETENVRHLTLRPPPVVEPGARLQVDSTIVAGVDLGQPICLRRQTGGDWSVADSLPAAGEKQPDLSGPFGDLFRRPTVLVRGTIGSREESFFIDWCARDAARFFKKWNGGVHRGGLAGESWMEIPIVTDSDWLASGQGGSNLTTRNSNVVAYGTERSNGLLAELADQLKVRIEADAIHVGERVFKGGGLGLIAALPHPDGSDRYVGMHGGTSPDAITAGAHLHWQLLPDYLVYDSQRAVEWGFFDNSWQPRPAGSA
jgi:hypothetical protein